jgi:hypothetical protein
MDGLVVAASTADYLASITNSNGTDAGGGLFVSIRVGTLPQTLLLSLYLILAQMS